MPNGLRDSHLTMEDVHSFVLRVYLNPAPDGLGDSRPQFNLEYVNQDTNLRLKSMDEVVKELTARIDLILHGSDGGLN